MSMAPPASNKKRLADGGGNGAGRNAKFKCKVAMLCVLFGQFLADARHITPKTSTSQPTDEQDVCGILQSKHHNDDPNLQQEFPWVVVLNYRQLIGRQERVDSFHCFGSLISDKHVLTAASCVDVDWWLLVIESVRVGKHNMQTAAGLECVSNLNSHECTASTLDISIERILILNTYDPITLEDNLAVIKLAGTVVYTDYVKPICWRGLQYIHEVNNKLKYNYTYWTSGYFLEDQLTIKTQKWEIAKEECETRLAHYFDLEEYNLTDHTLCTRDANTKCIMDTGSPLFYLNKNNARWYQRGVSSFNTNCSENNSVTNYAKLEDYEEWIMHAVTTLI